MREVHQAYVASGARVITTNSYALVPFHIGDARFVAEGKGWLRWPASWPARWPTSSLVACRWSAPCRRCLVPTAPTCSTQAGRASWRPRLSGRSPHVDLWLAETMSLIAEPLAIRALLPEDGKPFWVSFTLEDEAPGSEPTLRSGERVADAVTALASRGGRHPVQLLSARGDRRGAQGGRCRFARAGLQRHPARRLCQRLPPQPKEATANDGLDEIRTDLGPLDYLGWAERWRAAGANLIGGCCGIGPEHIQALASRLR